MFSLTTNDEQRLRELANGIARGVEDDDLLLQRLGFTRQDYDELCQTRMFKAMLNEATSEWEGAANTRKRIELKAAISVEQALAHFYQEMISAKEPLSSKVKALEVVARIGKLGNPDPVSAGAGQYFKLEINLGGGKPPLILENEPSYPSYSESSGSGSRLPAIWAGVKVKEEEEL